MLRIEKLHHRCIKPESIEERRLFNSDGLAICHRMGCTATKITYTYHGFFCSKHRSEVRDIRRTINRYSYEELRKNIDAIETVIAARERESNIRKITDAGHQMCIGILKERLQTLTFFNQHFLQIANPMRGMRLEEVMSCYV